MVKPTGLQPLREGRPFLCRANNDPGGAENWREAGMATPNREREQPARKITEISAWLRRLPWNDTQRLPRGKPARASYLSLVPEDEGDEPELAA